MQPLTFLVPFAYTLFLWWFTTGLVFALFGRRRVVQHVGIVLATALVVVAIGGIMLTRDDASATGVYVSITCGVVLWMWQTATYFLDYVTGIDLPESAGEPTTLWQRFRVALWASIHHEVAAFACGVLLMGLLISAENRWALYIYVALWLMHSSAKLNVFFGVRNFRIDFMPSHLHALKRLIGKRDYNLLTPFSLLYPSVLGLLFVFRAFSQFSPAGATVGYMIVGTMLLLGVLEHVLLVVPVPAMLWGWSTRPLDERVLPEPVKAVET